VSPSSLAIRGLLVLMLAVVIVWAWWYYRPTIEPSAGLSSGIAAISIGISMPTLLTVFVVVVVLFAMLKLLL
jgi:hypothetical protein